MHIFKNQILIYPHILSYTANVNQSDVCAHIEQIRKEAEALGLKVTGNIITTVKSENAKIDRNLSEIEFLIPVDRQLESMQDFKYKSHFKLINAVKARYEGDMREIKKGEVLLQEYLGENGLEPITGYYFSFIQALADSPDSVIADIYVGINANVL